MNDFLLAGRIAIIATIAIRYNDMIIIAIYNNVAAFYF